MMQTELQYFGVKKPGAVICFVVLLAGYLRGKSFIGFNSHNIIFEAITFWI